MAKESGLGDYLFLDGIDLSGDIGAVGTISAPLGVLPATNITQYAQARMAGEMDGAMSFTAYFNPSANATHVKLSALPTASVIGSYFHGQAIGNPAASVAAKQVGYDGNRGTDGSFMLTSSLTASDGFSLEWGNQLTAGKRSDTAATNGASLDSGVVSTLFGWQAYLHVFSFTGTSATMTLQDSANDSVWANLTTGAFTAVTAAGKERIASATITATVRRYVRVITTGTFSQCTFAVNFVRNQSQVLP